LNDGEAQTASCSNGRPTYFEFALDDSSAFTIAASPVNGDPDVVVSLDYTEPNSTAYTWQAQRWGFDVINIKTDDPNYRANAVYNIGVYAFPNSQFTIAATKVNSYTTIVEGVPLTQTVESKQYKYFKFYMEESNIDLIFTVTALASSGDPDMYITYNRERPNATNYDYVASKSGSDSIFIPTARTGVYYVAVYGFTQGDFQITANTEYKSILLTEGNAWRGVLEPQKYGYFKFFHGDYEAGVSLAMTLHNGDAQMFISTTNTRPTGEAGKFEYTASKIGNNLFWYVPGNTFSSEKTIYVGVYATVNLTYSIIAQTNQSYTVLRDGELNYWNHVSRGYYRYFIYDTVDPTQDISISVNPWEGETSLFVSTTAAFPTAGNYQWMSRRYKQDTAVIRASDPLRQGKTRFYIGVLGQQESQFSITAFMSNASTIALSDGIPVSGGIVRGKYNFYSFNVQTTSSLTVSLTLDDPASTDADLFLSFNNPKPSQFDHDLKGDKFGSDFIRVPYAFTGTVYIGVYGFTSAFDNETVQYTLVASVESQIITANRADVISFALANRMKTFKTYIPPTCDFVVLATNTIFGRTDMIASSNETGLTESNFNWHSRSHPSNLIMIRGDDPNYKAGFWSIGVLPKQDSDFFISATCGGSRNYVWLSESIPKLNVVPPGGVINFMFFVDWRSLTQQRENFYLIIKPIRSPLDVEVFNSFDREGKRWNFTGSDYHVLKLSKDEVKAGIYRVIATGASHYQMNSVFEITLTRDNAPVFLGRDNLYIQSTALSADSTTYYRILNSFTNQYPLYAITESCTEADAPTIYCDPKNEKPTPDAPYKSKVIHNYVQELFVPNTTETKSVSMWNLAIKGNNYGIYSVVDINNHPTVPVRRIAGQNSADGQVLILHIKRAKPAPGWVDTNMTYYVYTYPMPNGPIEPFNFFTSCSLIARGNKHLAIPRRSHDGADPEDLELHVFIPGNFNRDIGYRLNILAENGLGLTRTYEPVYYIYGGIFHTWPRSNFSIGFVLIFIVFLVFALYMLVGTLVNVIRGKRGIDVIPNVNFWRSLPFLIWEGFTAVFCCKLCKRNDDAHVPLDESSVQVEPSLPAVSNQQPDEHVEISLKPNSSSTGGYGSV